MSVSLALQEAYASGDEEGIVLTTAEIDHASFDAPIRIVSGVDGAAGDEDDLIPLPLVAGGQPIGHKPCAFGLTRPGHDEDGPTDARVRIDNVSALLQEPLKLALGYNLPIHVTFRQYRVLPGQLGAVHGPDEVIEGLLLSRVVLQPDTAEGTLSWPDGRSQNVPTGPNAFFDRSEYPGLFA